MKIDENTPIACLTVGQFLELQRTEKARPLVDTQDLPKYLNPVDLSKLINWKLTTVYQNHHNGLIPGACKIGNRLLFDSKIILKWIEDGRVLTFAERVQELERRLIR
jgi:hypothetical protein